MNEITIIRFIARSVIGLLLAVVLAYPLDWLIWRARLATGTGMGSVTLEPLTTAALKGNREAYYPEPTIEVSCSRSLFPEAGSGACWWLSRHREQRQSY